MREYVIMGLIIVLSLVLGFLFGRFGLKHHRHGEIIIEMNEDRSRERVRFVIDVDLEDLKKKNQIVLKVNNTLSKK